MGLSALLLAANIAILAIAFLYFRSYLRRRTGAERILAEFREEVDKLLLEINTTTDRDLTLVEERVNALKELLDSADKRIILYRREIERRDNQEAAYADLGRRYVAKTAASAPPGNAPYDIAPQEVAPQGVAPQNGVPHDAAPYNGAPHDAAPYNGVPHDAAPYNGVPQNVAPHDAAPHESLDSQAAASQIRPRFVRSSLAIEPKPPSNAEHIREWHRAGFSAEIIASRLGITVSEVDTIIALSEEHD